MCSPRSVSGSLPTAGSTPGTWASCPSRAPTSRCAWPTSRWSWCAIARASCTPTSTCAGTEAPRWCPEGAAARPCSATTTPGPTISTAPCARPRARRPTPISTAAHWGCARLWWTRGDRSSSSTPTRTPRRWKTPCASCRRSWRAPVSTSTSCAFTPGRRSRSRPTGRSRWRTSSSATTARSPTRASAT